MNFLTGATKEAVDRRCQVHYTALLVDDATGMIGNDGFSLKITLPHHTAQLWHAPMEQDDETSMLQRPTTLRLHDHLEEQTSGTKVDCQPAYEALTRLDGIFLLPSFDVEELCNWHWASEWLQNWWDGTSPFYNVAMYFDGSFKKGLPTQAGLGVATFVETATGWCFAGFHACSLTCATDSYQAEQLAAVVSVKVLYDLLRGRYASEAASISVYVYFDSITVGQQARGGWASRQHPSLGKVIRSLFCLCEVAFGTQFHFEHIKSHTGHPGNELADYLADAAAQGWQPFDMNLSPWLDLATDPSFVRAIEWCWILFDHQFSGLWKGMSLVFPALAPSTWNEGLLQTTTKTQTKEATPKRLLRLCSFNALSVAGEPDAQGSACSGPARLHTALRQFQELGIHIFAIQETRMRNPTVHQVDEYHLFHAPADPRGHFGITIGITTQRPYAPDSDLVFCEQHVHYVFQHPRSLILRVAALDLSFLCWVCMHPIWEIVLLRLQTGGSPLKMLFPNDSSTCPSFS